MLTPVTLLEANSTIRLASPVWAGCSNMIRANGVRVARLPVTTIPEVTDRSLVLVLVPERGLATTRSGKTAVSVGNLP